MKKNNGVYEAAGGAIRTGGIFSRLFGYAVLYIPITLAYVWLFLMIVPKASSGNADALLTGAYAMIAVLFVMLFPPAIPFILIERGVRKSRRKLGLPIYKDITKELEQMEIDERVRKEHQAYVNNGLTKENGIDKSDIGYWHSLLEKGAISKEEYEAKKAELL